MGDCLHSNLPTLPAKCHHQESDVHDELCIKAASVSRDINTSNNSGSKVIRSDHRDSKTASCVWYIVCGTVATTSVASSFAWSYFHIIKLPVFHALCSRHLCDVSLLHSWEVVGHGSRNPVGCECVVVSAQASIRYQWTSITITCLHSSNIASHPAAFSIVTTVVLVSDTGVSYCEHSSSFSCTVLVLLPSWFCRHPPTCYY